MYTAAREGGRINFKKTERSICLHRTRKWFGKTGKMKNSSSNQWIQRLENLHMIAAMSCRISTFPKCQKKRWNQRKSINRNNLKSKQISRWFFKTGDIHTKQLFRQINQKTKRPTQTSSYLILFPFVSSERLDLRRPKLPTRTTVNVNALHGFLKFTPAKPDKIQQGLEM